MAKIQKIPLDIVTLIWDNLSFKDIDKFFLLYPSYKEDINFWKCKLTKDIKREATKYPHLYVFNISNRRQNIFFDKIYKYKESKDIIPNKGKILKETYLACLYAFDVYIDGNEEYWSTEGLIFWHHVRNLCYPCADSVKSQFYILLENNATVEIVAKALYKFKCPLDYMRVVIIKYGEEFTTTNSYKLLLQYKAEMDIKNSSNLLHLFKTDKEAKDFIIDKYIKLINNKVTSANYRINDVIVPLLIYTNESDKVTPDIVICCYDVLKILKDPNFDINKKLPKIDMRAGGDNSGIENLCYYLMKKDDLILFNKVYKEAIPTGEINKSWFIINMFSFIIPGSKIYGRVIELTPKNIYIANISGFPLLYNLSLAFPTCKFNRSYPKAFELLEILQDRKDFNFQDKIIHKKHIEWDSAETCSNQEDSNNSSIFSSDEEN